MPEGDFVFYLPILFILEPGKYTVNWYLTTATQGIKEEECVLDVHLQL